MSSPGTASGDTFASHLGGDWDKIAERLSNDPRTSEDIRRVADSLNRSLHNVTFAQLPTRVVTTALTQIVEDATVLFGAEAMSKLALRDGAVIDLDDPWAESQVSDRGTRIALISSGFFSGVAMHSDALKTLTDNPDEHTIQASSAVLRFYHLQQAHFGFSATHYAPGMNKGRWDKRKSMALHFVLAHEIAHHVLGHDTPEGPRQGHQELEADAWAGLLLREGVQSRMMAGFKKGEALRGIYLALMTMHSRERGAFIRPSNTHPPIGQRWAAATREWQNVSQVWDEGTLLQDVVDMGSHLNKRLPEQWWQAMHASRHWKTNIRGEYPYAVTATLDKLWDTPRKALLEMLLEMPYANPDAASFARAIHVAFDSDESLSATLKECGVSTRTAHRILDTTSPLTRFGLVSAFTRNSLWNPDTPQQDRTMPAFVATALAHHRLQEDS
ncbi:MAG: hypothetical protein WA892_13290 [Ornithinimicrobium sp.]